MYLVVLEMYIQFASRNIPFRRIIQIISLFALCPCFMTTVYNAHNRADTIIMCWCMYMNSAREGHCHLWHFYVKNDWRLPKIIATFGWNSHGVCSKYFPGHRQCVWSNLPDHTFTWRRHNPILVLYYNTVSNRYFHSSGPTRQPNPV